MNEIRVKNYRIRLQQWLKTIGALVLTGALASSALAVLKKPTRKRTTKMLTQDGQLVEMDPRAIVKSKRKVKSDEIQNWVKK